MRLGVQAFLKCRGDARLADAGLARDQHDLAVARLGARPAAQQQVDLLVAADQRGQRRSAQCLEPARHDTLTQHLPTAHRLGVAVRVDCAEIAAVEQIADQTPGGRVDRHRVRLRRYLQPRGQVGGVADNLVVPALADRDEIANDDHARRDADPAPHRHLGAGSQGPDRRTQFEPGADRLLGVVFVRRGIAEKDEHVIPEMPGDEPVVAADRLRDAALKGADRLAQVFETHAVGSRRHADQFARHGGDLPTFGFTMPDRCGVRRGVDLRRRRYDAILLFGDDRPDETIAAAGHGLDPAVAAGRLTQHPAQRRDLHGEVALLDRLAGPRGLDQRVLRNHCAGPFDQCPQQGDRSPPERYGLAAAEQQVVLRVQAKWTQVVGVHYVSMLIAFQGNFLSFSDRL